MKSPLPLVFFAIASNGMTHVMCGIFGFVLKEPVQIATVFELLKKLEVHRYPQEQKPVGGYGAGVAIIKGCGEVFLEKIGKVNGSPAEQLARTVCFPEASVLIAHVRMPSEKFMTTASSVETAQPYVAKCFPNLTVVSAHNGYVTNYVMIRERLHARHVFESEKVELVDSEVVPHLFEELLMEKKDANEALNGLFSALEGPNTVSLLQIGDGGLFLHFIHKGKTRGLKVWVNSQNEVVFCSRKEPLMEEFGELLANGGFREKVSIPYNEDANLKLSLPIAF